MRCEEAVFDSDSAPSKDVGSLARMEKQLASHLRCEHVHAKSLFLFGKISGARKQRLDDFRKRILCHGCSCLYLPSSPYFTTLEGRHIQPMNIGLEVDSLEALHIRALCRSMGVVQHSLHNIELFAKS